VVEIFRSLNLVLFRVFCLCTVLPIYIEKAEERKLCYLGSVDSPTARVQNQISLLHLACESMSLSKQVRLRPLFYRLKQLN
jgi:hypothetical protein